MKFYIILTLVRGDKKANLQIHRRNVMYSFKFSSKNLKEKLNMILMQTAVQHLP